jgi:acyl carrier protein
MRLYKTGDLGRWRNDGTIEFVGRNDYQLKIRGYRVELGEIEARLAHQPGVGEAVVMAWEDEPGEKRLVGYVVATRGAQIDGEQVRKSLREDLPEYMVPEAVMVLQSLPVTANGKVDRKKLPKVEKRIAGYKAPRTPQEEVVSLLFAELLGLERVGVDDNFFHLGGHSLLAMRLVGRIRATLGVDLAVRQVFEFATVAQVAEYVASQQQRSLTEASYANPSAVRSNEGPK